MKKSREYSFSEGWLSGFTQIQVNRLLIVRHYRTTPDIKVSPKQHQILVGLILGDLFVQRRKPNWNSSLAFWQGADNKDYVFHLFDIFKEFCNKEPQITSRIDKRNNKTYSYAHFTTRNLLSLNCYRELFYLNGVKIVPGNIGDLLAPISLAYWAMDDGYADRKGFMFCTDSFLKDEVILLTQVLQDKFKLDCSVREIIPGRCRIYIKFKSMATFRALVEPFFHPSMMYKINGCKRSTTEGGLSKPLPLPKKNFTGKPGWLSGFTQASGSFTVAFEKRKSGLFLRPRPIFNICQHISELELFKKMQEEYGIGFITQNKKNQSVSFIVTSLKEIDKVLFPIFDKYPLSSGKLKAYLVFKGIVKKMLIKEHLTLEGLFGIIEASYYINKATSLRTAESKDKLISFLEDKHGTLPSVSSKPVINEEVVPSYLPLSLDFVTGLIDGDGSFNVSFQLKPYRRVRANFTVVQETACKELLNELKNYFGCGNVYDLPSAASRYQVENVDLILNNIVPKLNGVTFNTLKYMHYEVLVKVCNIIKTNGYKSDDSFKEIIELAYDSNLSGKRRRLTKEEFLALINKEN
jgi:hypothetical protein